MQRVQCLNSTSHQLFRLEKNISDMIEVFVDLFNSVPGRMKAEMVRKIVIGLVDLWEKWGAIPKLLCQNLRFMFTSAYRDELLIPPNIERHSNESFTNFDGGKIDFKQYWNSELIDSNVDGAEINT